ncbi:MAG: prepilin-type N-terminal cleavage/methylation domain-containing protein [Planctomycetes bacterium]|nr:prepilin-type N-terminal cleavage/methylation domain-containing protein [Planctomycetota bacterium]
MKTTTHGARAGLSLLEVMVAMAVLAVLVLMAFSLTSHAAQFSAISGHKAHVQAKAQLALATLSTLVRESTADQVCPFRTTDPPGGTITFESGATIPATQVFLCFPVPRGPDGLFAFHQGGAVLSEPRWQGVAVVGYHAGTVREYVQFGTGLPFSGANPIRISAVSATTITLTNGTTFDRAGAVGAGQTSRVLVHDVAQLESPNYVTGQLLGGQPLQLKLTLLDRVRTSSINQGAGFTVVASFETGILARNRN